MGFNSTFKGLIKFDFLLLKYAKVYHNKNI